jgi:hypothetical protein
MADSLPKPFSAATGAAPTADPLGPTLSAVRRRLGGLRWIVPFGMLGLVVVFEFGPARWIENKLGSASHFTAELAFYGLLGPALAALLLDLLGRWIEERETTELQAQALARARQHAHAGRELADDTLQTLFAASALIATLEAHAGELPEGAADRLGATHRALDDAIQRLYARLRAD